jgi:AraC-like DNA-binding protein
MSRYEYNVKDHNAEQQSVCEAWNTAYNLNYGQMKYDIPEATGSGVLSSSFINRDIRIINYNLSLKDPIEMRGVSKEPHIDIMFCLGESIHWDLPESRKEFELIQGESYIGISRETKKECVFPAKCNMNILEIKIPVSSASILFQEDCYADTLESLKPRLLSNERHRISPAVGSVIHQLINSPYEMKMSRLYTEAKLLELLSFYLSESLLQTDKPALTRNLTKEDLECVYRAKEILDNNLVNPPTLNLLSKLIGLNEFKMKKGFKEVFGTSVHAYVIQKRLEIAKTLLDRDSLSVSEVAYRIGYGNVSHFASAFRKQYGINPGSYMKNIRI